MRTSSIALKTVLFTAGVVLTIAAFAALGRQTATSPTDSQRAKGENFLATSRQGGAKSSSTEGLQAPADSEAVVPKSRDVVAPIDRADERVTKKPLGLYVTRKNSPVTPERFSGYHAGVDFETFPEEQDLDVPVFAICSGPLALKKRATGYGGVAVQHCNIEGEPVTVIYGHVRLSSITANANDRIEQGAQIGVLGTGYGAETDGERKHLHLGIHKGSAIVILGYVQSTHALEEWLDIRTYLK